MKVELSGVPYDPQYQRLLLSQNGSIADKPDVFLMDNIWLGQFSENGLAANLDSYYASWAGASDISDNYVNSSKWTGSQYGVWAYSDIRLFIWNKDVFKAAGLDPEKAPTTWDEVMTDAAAIKAKVPGVSPVAFPAGSFEATVDRFYAYLFMTGSNILDPTNKKAVFNDAGGQKAVQFLVDLVKKGYASQDLLGLDADPIVGLRLCGQVRNDAGDRRRRLRGAPGGHDQRAVQGQDRCSAAAALRRLHAGHRRRRLDARHRQGQPEEGPRLAIHHGRDGWRRRWSRSMSSSSAFRSGSPAWRRRTRSRQIRTSRESRGGAEGRAFPALRRVVHADDRAHLDRHPERDPGHAGQGRTRPGGHGRGRDPEPSAVSEPDRRST